MPRRYMSEDEYNEQQYYYRHSLKSPQDLQEFLENKTNGATPEDIQRAEKMQDLKDSLCARVKIVSEECLTDRQKKVVHLYLMSKKQDYMATVLSITQEAAFSRIHLAFKRLRKECAKDEEIQKILLDMKNIRCDD